MTDEILKLNTNNELVAVDPSTGDTRPIKVADLSASGDVTASNVTADTQMNSSSTRPNIFADDVDANSITGVSTGADRQGCRVFLSANQSISQGSITKIQFDSEVYDSDNNFSTSSNDWTCPKDGLYMANLQIRFRGGGADQRREVFIGTATQKVPNNEGALNRQNSSDSNDRLSVSTINKYAQGDTIAGYVNNDDSNDTLGAGADNDRTFMEIAFLGGL